MRKLLFLIALSVAIAGSATWSLAGTSRSSATATAKVVPSGEIGTAAVRLPAAMPKRDAVHPDAYGFRPSAAIARDIQRSASRAPRAAGAAAAPRAAASAGAGASVTVTAVVLPVRTVVVVDGAVSEVWSNTRDRRPGMSLYTFRTGTTGGDPVAVTPELWAQLRAVMLRTNTALGQVY